MAKSSVGSGAKAPLRVRLTNISGVAMRDVTGKVAFITGGARGVGFGMARVFCAAGMKVDAALAKGRDACVARVGPRGPTQGRGKRTVCATFAGCLMVCLTRRRPTGC